MFDMFEKVFGKKRTEELLNKIADNVTKKIELEVKEHVKKTAEELEKNKTSQKEVIEVLDKRKKELEIAALERDIKNKAEHHTVNRINNTKWYKHAWYRCTSFFRLKIDEHNVKDILLNHKEASSPQALQGKWQAYGQMRASRTLARGSIFATGIVGGITAVYVNYKSEKSIELREKEEQLNKREKTIADSANYTAEFTLTTEVLKKQLLVADLKVKEFCNGDEKCYNDYNADKDKAENSAKEEIKNKYRYPS